MRYTPMVVAALVVALAGCGGGDGPTPPPPPPPPPPPMPVRTLDTLKVAFERPDLQDSWPSDVSVTAVLATGDRTVPIVTAGAEHDLVVPTGLASFPLRINGGAKYETRTWTVQSGQGRRYAAVLHPNCWTIRTGDFSGQNVCLSRSQLTSAPGSGDSYSFFMRWNSQEVSAPWGWRADLLPAQVRLVDPSPGGPLNSSDSLDIDSLVRRVNSATGLNLLRMGGRVTDSIPSVGSITVLKRSSSNASNGSPWTLGSGDILSGKMSMSPGGFVSRFPHEGIHVLGVGHTCLWATLMESAAACSSQYSSWFTTKDVAGIQMAYALRAQARRINANLSYF